MNMNVLYVSYKYSLFSYFCAREKQFFISNEKNGNISFENIQKIFSIKIKYFCLKKKKKRKLEEELKNMTFLEFSKSVNVSVFKVFYTSKI